jgi:GDPmannose 4,6-dehydratase
VADAPAGQPDDYVVATGETHSCASFCELAFGHVGSTTGGPRQIDEKFMRPAEVDLLIGDPAKAEKVLGWKPKVSFRADCTPPAWCSTTTSHRAARRAS